MISKEYQIRYEDDYGEESVEHFREKHLCQERYNELCCELQDAANHEGIAYEIEMIEVLKQHRFKPLLEGDHAQPR